MVIMQMFNGYGDLLYQFGMVDENEKAHIDNETQKAVNFMKQKDFYQAFLVKNIQTTKQYFEQPKNLCTQTKNVRQ